MRYSPLAGSVSPLPTPPMPNSFTRKINIQTLPVELLCHILSHLETSDLLSCIIVSKHFRNVMLDSSRLQYTIELSKYRMVSLLSSSSPTSYANRLDLLREREKAWRELTWKGRHTLRLPPTGSVYEFIGGLYGNGREDDNRVTASISFLELPSSNDQPTGDESQPKMWTHTMGDVTIIDFTMDPSQDLLVLVALAPPQSKHIYELHLRSISTNYPHPKAPLSVLSCLNRPNPQPPPPEAIPAVRVQVAGDLVALLIKEVLDSAGAHLEIWNWEHGPQYSCAMTRISGIDDFTFLAHDKFLLVRPTGRFEVYTFADPKNGLVYPTIIACYLFPPLADGYMYWYISMSSNPAPGYVPQKSNQSRSEAGDNAGCKQIYYPLPDERIHACCLYIFNPATDENHNVHSFVFFINIQTLLNPPKEWLELPKPKYPRARPAQMMSLTPRSHSSFEDSRSSTSSSSLSAMDVPLDSSFRISLVPTTDMSATSGSGSFPSYLNSIPPVVGDSTPGLYTPSPSQLHNISPPPNNNTSASDPMFFSSANLRNSIPARTPYTLQCVHVPWEVWGPQSTRWFEECLYTDWQHAIYGLRTVEGVKCTPHYNDPNYQTAPGSMSAEMGVSMSSPSASLGNEIDSLGDKPDPTLDENQSQTQGHEVSHDDRRFLRIRDFNPYSLIHVAGADSAGIANEKGKHKARWRAPRLVTGPSTTPVKGVFKDDIISWLPYTEVISEETFEVTDVMMDDSRLLLLKRGQAGKLKRVDVLMM